MRRASSSATLPAPPLDAEAAERRREYRSHGLQHSARASVELPVFVHLESPVLHYRDARSRGTAAAPRAASGFGATVDRDGGAAHGVVPWVRRRRSAASRDADAWPPRLVTVRAAGAGSAGRAVGPAGARGWGRVFSRRGVRVVMGPRPRPGLERAPAAAGAPPPFRLSYPLVRAVGLRVAPRRSEPGAGGEVRRVR